MLILVLILFVSPPWAYSLCFTSLGLFSLDVFVVVFVVGVVVDFLSFRVEEMPLLSLSSR